MNMEYEIGAREYLFGQRYADIVPMRLEKLMRDRRTKSNWGVPRTHAKSRTPQAPLFPRCLL